MNICKSVASQVSLASQIDGDVPYNSVVTEKSCERPHDCTICVIARDVALVVSFAFPRHVQIFASLGQTESTVLRERTNRNIPPLVPTAVQLHYHRRPRCLSHPDIHRAVVIHNQPLRCVILVRPNQPRPKSPSATVMLRHKYIKRSGMRLSI